MTSCVICVTEHGPVVLRWFVVKHIRDVALGLHRVANVANDSIFGAVKVADTVDCSI